MQTDNKNSNRSANGRSIRPRGYKQGKRTKIDRRIAAEVSRSLRDPVLSGKQIKYFDSVSVGNVGLLTVGYNIVSLIPQGTAQSQRVGDEVFPVRLEFRGQVDAANTDVFSSIRLVWFIWIPNTSSLIPGATSILESPSTFGPNSFYNYEGRQEYKILRDTTYRLAGTAGSPCNTSNMDYSGAINLNSRIVYNVSLTTGTHHIYILSLSDSAVTPFPVFTAAFRLWYYDS